MEQFMELAKLQLGMSAMELERILGDEWRMPKDDDGGYFYLAGPMLGLGPSYPFRARLTIEGTIGSLGYYDPFPNDIVVNGVTIGMTFEAMHKIYDALVDCNEESSEEHGIAAFKTEAPNGDIWIIKIKGGMILALTCERPGSQYPGEVSRKVYPKRDGMRAYDIEMLHREANRTSPDNHGWVFGLPPGIKPEQWPLDPISGYPLMHGFTIKLPEDYRVHGPDIVALSFFATADDQNGGGAVKRGDLFAAITNPNSEPPQDRDLLPFWKQATLRHPRLHRMCDVLDYEYAIVLLTEAEFNGPLCEPLCLGKNTYLNVDEKPQWMTTGSGFNMFHHYGGLGLGDQPKEELFAYKILGEVPGKRLDWNRAILCTPRTNDPNAGLAPMDNYTDGPAPTGYLNFSYFEGDEISAESYREHTWTKNHKPNHIGGTMRPVQATPEFSPFYIGFEEYFGGYNFGAGGNAQLDFLEMKFDWACG